MIVRTQRASFECKNSKSSGTLRRTKRFVVLAGLLISGIMAFAAVYMLSQEFVPEPQPAPILLAAAVDPLPVATVGLPDLELVSQRDAWIRIQGNDGTIFVSRIMLAGESYAPRLGHGWTISTKDGGAFFWRLEGQNLGKIATDGKPVNVLELDRELERLAVLGLLAFER